MEKKYDLIAFTDKGFSLDVRVDPDEFRALALKRCIEFLLFSLSANHNHRI